MKILKVPFNTDGYTGRYKDTSLEDYNLENIPDARLIAYNYGTAPYEGAGQAIVQFQDGTWTQLNLGHCSCNGPIREGHVTGPHKSLAELVATFSAELRRSCQGIIDALEAPDLDTRRNLPQAKR